MKKSANINQKNKLWKSLPTLIEKINYKKFANINWKIAKICIKRTAKDEKRKYTDEI